MKKELKAMGLPIGGPSLLMAFILLCLTVFASISFMSADRDFKLSQKTAETLTQYYAADNKAEEILAEIGTSLKENGDIEAVEGDIKEYNGVIMKDGDRLHISYSVIIKDEMVLAVTAGFTAGDGMDILGWQVVNNQTIEDVPVFLDLPAF